LCNQGCAIDVSCTPSSEDACSIASFIETKLVICYLKLGKPDDALNHSYRSISLNPVYFRNHLRLAAVFRCLERYSEAARSSMIAHHIYWMAGGTEQRTSELIKLYWQAMIVEAITTETSFSVMYTPFVTEVTDDKIYEINCAFARKHPDYMEYIYTDTQGNHILPETTNWPSQAPQKYLLTLGFKDKFIGKTMETWSRRKMPIFADREEPYMVVTTEETKMYWENTGQKILPVMDFIRSTRLSDDRCVCSRGIEKLHYSSLLGRMQRVEEQSQVINQAMAELATVPYLQDVNEKDGEQLQSLMAVTLDALAGRNIENSPVWDEIEKVKTCKGWESILFLGE
ncbi:spermatogenesis-associated protein 16, partial [Antrostomus carolinensis]|uniref:spermatogenesis-associated protein 16 n=1 Tax=Antrostomus carolinensis TaxID=279965 RepID=UPI0010A9951B